MSATDRAITLRALNYLRSAHVPTYVALRFLIDALPQPLESSAVTETVERLSYSRDSRIYDLQRFKCFDNATAEYRQYSIPSPTHALAESYALLHLQLAGLREKKSYVYSYRPPSSLYYPRNYLHFAEGYKSRNNDVLEAMSEGDVALVLDIKSFYPSVNARQVSTVLLDEAKRAGLDGQQLRVIEKCVTACAQIGSTGLRVGPEMSHTLADYALREVDSKLNTQFHTRYFRYVDDIVVVVPEAIVPWSLQFVEEAVGAAGFELNKKKFAQATKAQWGAHKNPFTSQAAAIDPLSEFKFRVKLFLARHPSIIEELSAKLAAMNVYLPIGSLAGATGASSWRERIALLWRSGWRVLVRYRLDSLQDILDAAGACQAKVRHDVAELLSLKIADAGLVRRWQLQHVRYVVNRALYFVRDEEIAEILEMLAGVHELDETTAVAAAISGAGFERIASMPGTAASAAAQLAQLRGIKPSRLFPWSAQSDLSMAADIAANFAMRGFGSTANIEGISNADAAALLRFASAQPEHYAIAENVSFGEEVMALGIGKSAKDVEIAASSRLLPDEEVILEALALSSAYASG